MLINFEELDRLKYELTDLGNIMSNLSSDNADYFENILKNTERLKESLGSLFNKESLEETLSNVATVSKRVDEFSLSLSELSVIPTGLVNVGNDLDKAATKFSEFASSLDKYSKSPSGRTTVKSALRGVESKKRDSKGRTGAVSRVLGREVSGVRSTLSSLAGKLMLPRSVTGQMASTGIAWMAYGFTESQRLEALAGKAKNVLISAVDGANKAAVDKGTEWLWKFTERMNKFYGISEKETLQLSQTFSDLGFSIDEAFNKRVGTSIEGLHGNFAKLSLELDKMFELSTGTMARRMGDYAHRFGMSLEESAESLVTMLALGRGEGNIGSLTFLNHIEKSMDALEKMGYRITEVIGSFDKLRKTFEDMGVPKFLAAKEAALGIQGISQGMGGMGMDWQVYASQLLGYGTGLEARNKFADAMSRLSEADPDKFSDEVVKLTQAIYEQMGKDEHRTKLVLEKGLNFGVSGARAALALREAHESGDPLQIKDSKDKVRSFQQEFKDSLVTERQKITDMQRFFNEWLVGLRHVGQGLLGVVADAMIMLIAFFKSIPAFFDTYFEKDQKSARARRENLMDKIKEFGSLMPQHLNLIKSGFSEMGDSGKKMGAEILGDTIDKFVEAIEYNPFALVDKYKASKDEIKDSAPKRSGVQVVTIPIVQNRGEESVFSQGGADALATGRFLVDSEAYRPSVTAGEALWDAFFSKEEEAQWYGGELEIVSHGVNDSGDILLSLQGNCPKCGLSYGKEDIEAVTQSLTSEPKKDVKTDTAEATSGKAGTVAKHKEKKSVFDYASPDIPEDFGIVSEGFIGGRFRRQSLRPGAPKGRTHSGIDINAPLGTPARVPEEGVVIHVGEARGAGKNIQIMHPGGETSWWMHMQSIAPEVGQKVAKGEVIGKVGATRGGAPATSPHIHLELLKPGVSTAKAPRTPASGKKYFHLRQDPMDWLKGLSVAPIEDVTSKKG